MVEMCRGVQHPTRGLFLRNYLSQMIKNQLPDVHNSSQDDGTVIDSIQFVLTNFIEMNKLWVRMQHQGHSRDRERREQERRELKILVGTNLVRLSQLEGIDLNLYQTKVLPAVLEQIVSCKDALAQEYLMEVIIQVFPDGFHLKTLEMFLDACSKLSKSVNVKSIVTSLIDRLARYAANEEGGIPQDIPLFDIFSKQIQQIFVARPDMALQDIIALQVSLLSMSISCYPGNLDYVDLVLKITNDKLSTSSESKGLDKQNSAAGKQLIKLLSIPVENFNNIITVLKLVNFPPLIAYLSYSARKSVAVSFVENVIKNDTYIPEADDATKFLELIGPLVHDEEGQGEISDEDLAEEQSAIARMTHLFYNSISDKQYQLLSTIRKHFGAGGARIKYTLPSLVFASLRLANRYLKSQSEDQAWEKKCQKVFQFSHQTTTALVKAGHYELCLRLFLQCAQAADACSFETIAYEFITQSFLIYEENIADSKAQLAAITLIIGTLQTLRVFGPENQDTLTTKCALYSSKLLKKPDQCSAVQLCSHLFWPIAMKERGESDGNLIRDGKRVLECLQKSLKIADGVIETGANVQLFVEILNRYVYYFEKHNDSVTVKYVSGLIDLISSNLANLDAKDENTKIIKNHFANTLKYIQYRKEHPEGNVSMDEIDTSALNSLSA